MVPQLSKYLSNFYDPDGKGDIGRPPKWTRPVVTFRSCRWVVGGVTPSFTGPKISSGEVHICGVSGGSRMALDIFKKRNDLAQAGPCQPWLPVLPVLRALCPYLVEPMVDRISYPHGRSRNLYTAVKARNRR